MSSPFENKQGVRQCDIVSAMHYKLFSNDMFLLFQMLGIGMTIGHIDGSSPTCADDVALLATALICLQLLLCVVKYYNDRERYGINTSSLQVGLAEDKRETFHGTLTLGEEAREPSPSEVHLGVERNLAGTSDIAAKVQTGRRTMYALLGVGAYRCSVVTPPLVAHLWTIYALPRMTYGLEVFKRRASA